MAQSPQARLDKLISWSFTLTEQGQVTRYGAQGGAFYKQFLPGGIEVLPAHPVKKIDQRLYDLAHQQYLTRLKKS